MATFTALQNRILNDLHRDDVTSQVSQAISDAVRYYERENFWFQEGQAVLTTSASQVWYGSPPDMKQPDFIKMTFNGEDYPLRYVHYSEIEAKDTSGITGQPSEYCFYQNNIRFYPVPDASYVATMSYKFRAPDMSASSSNTWTNEAASLIRYRAAWDVYKHYLRNPDMAELNKGSEIEEFQTLMGESTKKLSTGKLKRSGF